MDTALVIGAGAGVGIQISRQLADARYQVSGLAAIRVFRAAEALGWRRVILISAYGTESGDPEGYNAGWWKYYYATKHAAKQALVASTLPWTILRPGGLTDQPGTGRVQLGAHVPFGDIPRADVAATAVAVLASPASAGRAWSLVSGTTPVTEAVTAVAEG
jgi:uncharacterized protein YbjT (DUF2867 family)